MVTPPDRPASLEARAFFLRRSDTWIFVRSLFARHPAPNERVRSDVVRGFFAPVDSRLSTDPAEMKL